LTLRPWQWLASRSWLNPGAYQCLLIVREIVVVWVNAPDTPVTVSVNVPRVAVLLAVIVSILVVAVEEGLKLAVTPAGSPAMVRLTLPLNPLAG